MARWGGCFRQPKSLRLWRFRPLARAIGHKPVDEACDPLGLRRMVGGQHHKVSAQHLHAYAAHAAWQEDHRRLDNGSIAHKIVGLALTSPVSRTWAGQWQKRA